MSGKGVFLYKLSHVPIAKPGPPAIRNFGTPNSCSHPVTLNHQIQHGNGRQDPCFRVHVPVTKGRDTIAPCGSYSLRPHGIWHGAKFAQWSNEVTGQCLRVCHTPALRAAFRAKYFAVRMLMRDLFAMANLPVITYMRQCKIHKLA